MVSTNEFQFGMKVYKEEGYQNPQFIFSHFMVAFPIKIKEIIEKENDISEENDLRIN